MGLTGRAVAWAAIGWTAAGLAAIARAEPAPAFPDLLREASAAAPRLAEADAAVRAAQGRAEQAGARPNPTLSLEVENIGGPKVNGLSERQTTLSASQTLELGGKRETRTAAGRAEAAAAEVRARQARADFAFDLASAYVAAEAARTRSGLIAGDLARAEEDLRAARVLVQAGREADLRAVQAEAEEAAVRAELEGAKAEAAEALARLSALAGHAPAYTAVGPSLLAAAEALRPPAEAPPSLTPAVAVARAEREAAARRVAMERARATPDVTVAVGARRFGGEDATALVGSVSAPIPLFDRNRGATAAARAELDAAEARLRAAELEAESDWRAGLARAAASAAGLAAAARGEEAAGEAYRLSRLGYEGGKTPLAEVLAARRRLFEAQTRTVEARAQRVRAQAALARLAGTAIGDRP